VRLVVRVFLCIILRSRSTRVYLAVYSAAAPPYFWAEFMAERNNSFITCAVFEVASRREILPGAMSEVSSIAISIMFINSAASSGRIFSSVCVCDGGPCVNASL
jgi:uncharacterized FAD-dependent dehydrogenase